MRRIAIGTVLAVGMILGGASTAFAGETKGNGDPIERGGQPKSACSFSGQDVNDADEGNPFPFLDDDWNTNPGKKETAVPSGVRVQNWGQIVVATGEGGGVPGQECRGNVEAEH